MHIEAPIKLLTPNAANLTHAARVALTDADSNLPCIDSNITVIAMTDITVNEVIAAIGEL